VITSDRVLFGATIRSMYALGSWLSKDRSRGYALANILVFCVAWPAVMYALWVRAWLKHQEISALRAALREREVER
jgi:hypothetical protein